MELANLIVQIVDSIFVRPLEQRNVQVDSSHLNGLKVFIWAQDYEHKHFQVEPNLLAFFDFVVIHEDMMDNFERIC